MIVGDRHPRLVLAGVREQGAAVDVSDREQPVVARDPHPVVDLDRLAGRQADRLEPEVVVCGLRPTATSSSSLCSSRLSSAEGQREDAVAAAAGLRHLGAEPDIDAPRASASQRAARRQTAPRRRAARSRFDERDLASRARTTPARARTRRRLRRGSSGAREPARRVVPARLVHGSSCSSPGIGGIAAPLPTASTTARRASSSSSLDAHAALAVEPGVAADQRDPALLDPRQLNRVVEVVDHLVAPSQGRSLGRACRWWPHERPGTRCTSASSSAGRSSALDGMQA